MPDITAPNAQAYGTYEAALAQMLAGGGQIAGPLNNLALNGYARQQRGQYDLALQRTQAMQQQQAQEANRAELQKQYISSLPALTAAGGGTSLPSDQFGIETFLPAVQTTANAINNGREASTFENNTAGIANLAEIGQVFSPAATSELALTGRIASEEDQTLMPGMTPGDQSDRMRAENDAVKAKASMISANRPASGGGGGGGQRTSIRMVQDPLSGEWIPTITTSNATPSQVEALMPGGMDGTNVVERSGGARSVRDRERAIREANR